MSTELLFLFLRDLLGLGDVVEDGVWVGVGGAWGSGIGTRPANLSRKSLSREFGVLQTRASLIILIASLIEPEEPVAVSMVKSLQKMDVLIRTLLF